MDTMQFNANNTTTNPHIVFFRGDHVEVMRITQNGVTVPDDLSVDEAAKAVLAALDHYIRQMVADKDTEIMRLKAQLAAHTGDTTNG